MREPGYRPQFATAEAEDELATAVASFEDELSNALDSYRSWTVSNCARPCTVMDEVGPLDPTVR